MSRMKQYLARQHPIDSHPWYQLDNINLDLEEKTKLQIIMANFHLLYNRQSQPELERLLDRLYGFLNRQIFQEHNWQFILDKLNLVKCKVENCDLEVNKQQISIVKTQLENYNQELQSENEVCMGIFSSYKEQMSMMIQREVNYKTSERKNQNAISSFNEAIQGMKSEMKNLQKSIQLMMYEFESVMDGKFQAIIDSCKMLSQDTKEMVILQDELDKEKMNNEQLEKSNKELMNIVEYYNTEQLALKQQIEEQKTIIINNSKFLENNHIAIEQLVSDMRDKSTKELNEKKKEIEQLDFRVERQQKQINQQSKTIVKTFQDNSSLEQQNKKLQAGLECTQEQLVQFKEEITNTKELVIMQSLDFVKVLEVQ